MKKELIKSGIWYKALVLALITGVVLSVMMPATAHAASPELYEAFYQKKLGTADRSAETGTYYSAWIEMF